MLWQALGAARDLGRVQDIASVLIKYGFGEVVQRIGMSGALERAGKALHWDKAGDQARMKPPERARKVLEELGPTFVKLGQVMATRVDLFPPDWLEEFEKLQSDAPPLKWEEIREQLTEDLGGDPDEFFEYIDHEPLAAASLAQVHRARLRPEDGEDHEDDPGDDSGDEDGNDNRQDDQRGRTPLEVVLKVRRPGIRPVVEADLRLLKRLAEIIESEADDLRRYRPRHLVRQFAQALRRELDFEAECRNAERIAAALDEDSGVVVPGIHWQYCSERLNVQDYLEGIPGQELEALDEAGLDRREIARRGTRAVLKMILEDGFFHADPHPGNVLYLPDNYIGLLDFGMVGRLSEVRRHEVAELLRGLAGRDPESVTRILIEWNQDEDPDEDRLCEDVSEFIDQYHGLPLEQLELSAMIGEMTAVLRQHHLMLPPDLALMIKAFITLEGFGRGLDPTFDMAGEAAPVIEEALHKHYSVSSMAHRARQTLGEVMRLLGSLPTDLRQLIRAARRGRIEVQVDIKSLIEVSHRLDQAASRLTLGVITAALIIGSAIVLNVEGDQRFFGLPSLGLMGFVGATLTGVWLLFSIWRSGRK